MVWRTKSFRNWPTRKASASAGVILVLRRSRTEKMFVEVPRHHAPPRNYRHRETSCVMSRVLSHFGSLVMSNVMSHVLSHVLSHVMSFKISNVVSPVLPHVMSGHISCHMSCQVTCLATCHVRSHVIYIKERGKEPTACSDL